MLGLIVAAACLWRGLTTDETDAVETELLAQLEGRALEDLSAGEARDLLEAAIGDVVAIARSGF